MTLPYTVGAVCDGAFSGCNALTDVYAKMVNPSVAFANSFTTTNVTLHVRPVSLDSYTEAPYWSDFAEIVGDIIVDADFPDLNGDNKVDVGDVNIVLGMILDGSTDPAYDINGDGRIDVGDVNSILSTILNNR